MKKSTILITALIYVASIFVIGFFGMNIKVYDQIVYLTDIEVINEEMSESKVIPFEFVEGGTPEENVLQLYYVVYPANATNKKIEYIYDTNNTIATVDNFGRVWFMKKGVLRITLKGADGGNVIEEIRVYAR